MTEQPQAASLVADALKAGMAIAEPKAVAGTSAFILPPGAQLKTLEDLEEKLRAVPSRLASTISVENADSFIDYYNRFSDDTSTIFLNTDTQQFTAVLDYHNAPDAPRRGLHRLVFSCPKNREWSDWLEHSGKKMEQIDLALFIEQHIEDIREPSGAEMLEIATSLKAERNLNFQKSTRLADGQTQFTYNETINGSAGVTKVMTIPEEFMLGLHPIKGSDAYEVRCKFRWRISSGGALSMWYDIIRPDKIRDAAINDVRAKIAAKMARGMIINGTVAM